jgi:TP901 family phage tail tape measure protein
MATKPIVIAIQGNDSNLKKALKKASDRVEGFGKKVAKVGVAAGAAFGASAVAISSKGITAFADWEKGLNETLTLLGTRDQAVFDQMSQQAKNFARDFGVLPDELLPALYDSISAGIPQGSVFEFLEQAHKASVAGVSTIGDAVDGLSSVLNSYGQENISAAETSDLMLKAVALGKTTFGELSASIFQMAPIASAVGIPFKDLTTSIANLTAKGTPTSVAATQMKAAMAELAKEGTKADVAFRDLTGMGLQQFLEEEGNFASAIISMKEGADKAGISVLDMFGSIEAGQGILALTSDGGQKYLDTLGQMGNASGATEEAFKTMDSTMSASFDKVKANLSILAIEVGEKLAPMVEKASGLLLKGFRNLKPAIQTARTNIVNLAKRIKAFVLPIFHTVTDWVNDVATAVINYLAPGFQVLWEKIRQVKDIIVDLVQDGVAFLVDAFNKINWGEVGEKLLEVFTAVKKAVIDFAKAVPSAFETALEWVQKYRKVIITVGGAVAGLVVGFYAYKAALVVIDKWNKLVAISTKLWNAAMALNPVGIVVVAVIALVGALIAAYTQFESVRDVVHKVAKFFRDKILPIFKAFWESIVEFAMIFWDSLKDIFVLVKALFTGDWATVWEKAKELVGNAMNVIVATFIKLPMRIFEALLPLLGLVLGLFGDLFVALGKKIADEFMVIVEWFAELGGRILSAVSSFGEDIVFWIGDALSDLFNAVKDWYVGYIEWWGNLGSNVINAVSGFGSDLIGWITGAVSGMFTTLKDWVNVTLLPFFFNLPKRIVDNALLMVSKLLELGKTFAMNFLDGLKMIIGSTYEFATRLKDSIVGFGGAIVDWLVTGIKNGASRIWDALKGIIGSTTSWLPSWLNPFSKTTSMSRRTLMNAPWGNASQAGEQAASAVSGQIDWFSNAETLQHFNQRGASSLLSMIQGMENADKQLDMAVHAMQGSIFGQQSFPGEVQPLTVAQVTDIMRSGGFNSNGSQTAIDITVNAGMGTDGAEVGQAIVESLQDWQRQNGSIPIATVAQ